MKTVAFLGGIAGIILAVIAYFAELKSWMSTEVILTIGFAGYVLIITAIAYFLLAWLYKGSKKLDVL
ncbi:MAG: hypothetical protein ACTHLD_19320 [Chitinophaga sp.]